MMSVVGRNERKEAGQMALLKVSLGARGGRLQVFFMDLSECGPEGGHRRRWPWPSARI